MLRHVLKINTYVAIVEKAFNGDVYLYIKQQLNFLDEIWTPRDTEGRTILTSHGISAKQLYIMEKW